MTRGYERHATVITRKERLTAERDAAILRIVAAARLVILRPEPIFRTVLESRISELDAIDSLLDRELGITRALNTEAL